MKRAKTCKEIYNIILKEMPKQLKDIEKIAYIMMKIAENRSFSSKYYWSDAENRKKIYDNARKEKNRMPEQKKQLMCVTAARMLKSIAREFGIDIYYLGAEGGTIQNNGLDNFINGEHIIPLYKTEDGRFIKVDVERNLDNIQCGKKWTNFGTKDGDERLVELGDEVIANIMKKIGYIKDENEYFDNYIKILMEKHQDLDFNELLTCILEDTNVSIRAGKLESSVDIFRFYRKIIGQLDINDKNTKVYIFGGKNNHSVKRRKYTVGIYLQEEQGEMFWLWSRRQNKMISISREELEYFIRFKGLELVSPKNNIAKIIGIKNVDVQSINEDIFVR